MKEAKRFIKDHGWSLAIIEANNDTVSFGDDISFSLRQDLKTLVDAYEFIIEHSGIERCKDWYKSSPFKQDKYMKELKQAIKLVESVEND